MKVSKFYVYSVGSVAAMGYYIQNAIATHKQFFPTVVALTNSKAFGIILANGLFALLCLFGVVLTRLFFGKLQQNDRRKLSEFMAYHFVDTCIVLSYFRDSVSTAVTTLLVLNGFLRMFHHLVSTQQDNLEQTGQTSKMKVLKLVVLLGNLFVIDTLALLFYSSRVMKDGVSVYLLLALESTLMALIVLSTSCKLLLHQIEVYMGRMWELKGVLKFYVELLFEFASCALYIGFFIAKCTHQQFPFHLIRELLSNVRRTGQTLQQFLRYQKMAALVERKFPDATPQELDVDRTCAICYDEMENDTKAKRLPCAHCFHYGCLRRWVEKNTACPYCWQEFEKLIENQENQAAGGAAAAAANANRPAAEPAAANDAGGQQQQPPAGQQQGAGAEDPRDEQLIKAAYAAYLHLQKQAEEEAKKKAETEAENQLPVVRPAKLSINPKPAQPVTRVPLTKPKQTDPEEEEMERRESSVGNFKLPPAERDASPPGPSPAATPLSDGKATIAANQGAKSKLFAPAPPATSAKPASPITARASSQFPTRTESSPMPAMPAMSWNNTANTDRPESVASSVGSVRSNMFDVEEIAAYREYQEDCKKAQSRLDSRLQRIESMRRESMSTSMPGSPSN